MAVVPYTPSEVDAFRERGDAFNRDMLQEYYDHFAGLKDTLDIERVYEEYEDLTSSRQRSGSSTLRASLAVCLRRLPRQPHAVAPGEGGGGRGHAGGDRRRRHGSVPDVARRDVQRARPRQAATPRRGHIALLDEHLNPLYIDAHRIDRDAIRELNAPNYYEL